MTPQELKNSILQLAIQGRLVEQRPEEGTAEELYRQIQREKAALVKAGKIKKEKPLPEITEEEVPFEIPEGWKWVRIGQAFNIVNGFTPRRTEAKYWEHGNIPWFTIDDVRRQGRFIENTAQYITPEALSKNTARIIPADSVLLCCTASVGEYAYARIPLTTNQQFNAFVVKDEFKDIVFPMYVYEYVQTLKDTLIINAGKTTFNFLSVGKLSNMLFPLPPLAEQKRIVAKIEELLPYIDRYEVAWSRLEDFNKRFPTDMQKSILQLAIQGKLVPQRPDEGTGEALYHQIQAEKQSLIRSGKLKKEKPLPEITPNEIPFEIPENWTWVHLNDVSFTIGDIDHKMPEKISGKGIPYISPLDFTPQGIDYDRAKQISLEDFELLGKKIKPERDDIIFPRYGTIGVIRMVDTDRPFLVSYSCCTIKNMVNNMYPKYVFYVLKSPMIQDEINKYINKTTQPNVGLASIKRFLFPLPPLAEQKRIVAKLEELLPLCERLK